MIFMNSTPQIGEGLELISKDSNDAQLAYFFEEISLFWLKRYEIINFFLSKEN
ncbi:hypothetical protein AusDCA_1774 [Desulfitobacterium sp. AusDCA]